MGYDRAEPDTFGRYLNYFRVPGGETIPNKRTVRKRLRKGEDPTRLSFEKWDRIAEVAGELDQTPNPARYYADLRGYLSAESCALCLDSIERLRRERGEYKYREEKCEVCPLAEIEACTKRGSVFDRIDDILAYAFDPKTPPDQLEQSRAVAPTGSHHAEQSARSASRTRRRQNARQPLNCKGANDTPAHVHS